MKHKEPENREDLQGFLGMTTYLSKFIPNYSQTSPPSTTLLEKDCEWHWEHQQATAFAALKRYIANAPMTLIETTISVDASTKGIGAVLMQDAYASKSLTVTKQNYVQIEKEMLAVVFCCVKFQDYIYGSPSITIETDHKPFEAILSKPLHATPAQLQQMIMSIQKYPIHVVYKTGKELLIADAQSWAPLPQHANELIFQQYDINILHTLSTTEPKLAEIKEQTNKDTTLCDLAKTVQDGWPETKADVLPGAKPF